MKQKNESKQLGTCNIPSLKTKSIYNKETTTDDRPQYQLFVDGILSFLTRDEARPESENLTDLINFLTYLTKKYPSKMIFGIYFMEFAGLHELKNIFCLYNSGWLDSSAAILERDSIIRRVTKKSKNHDLILRFWKHEYPNSRISAPPKIYELFPDIKDSIVYFAENYCKKFIVKQELSKIYQRKTRWENFKKIVIQQERAFGEHTESLASCVKCEKEIYEAMKRGSDYHIFEAGYFCDKCVKSATNKELVKWMSKKN